MVVGRVIHRDIAHSQYRTQIPVAVRQRQDSYSPHPPPLAFDCLGGSRGVWRTGHCAVGCVAYGKRYKL